MEQAISDASDGKSDCLERSRAIIASLFRLAEQEPRMMQFILLAQHREYLPEEPPICSSSHFSSCVG